MPGILREDLLGELPRDLGKVEALFLGLLPSIPLISHLCPLTADQKTVKTGLARRYKEAN